MTATRCCPFCTSQSYAGIFTSDGIPVVVCSRCGAQSPTKHNNLRVTCIDDALAAWEDRQELEELKREIESLREQLQFTEEELTETEMHNRELRNEIQLALQERG